jgi:hypothetical protein
LVLLATASRASVPFEAASVVALSTLLKRITVPAAMSAGPDVHLKKLSPVLKAETPSHSLSVK